jgi:hypothetical protein
MRRTVLNAEYVSAERGDETVTVAFADDEFDVSEYVLLQRLLKVTDKEAEIGLGQVYIERNDQRYASYGGIRQCVVTAGSVEILLEPAMAKALGTRWRILVRFEAPPAFWNELKEHLELLFAEEPDIVVIDA